MALQLTVVTPEGQAFDGTVDQVVLPGSEGDFGVLEQHERFLTSLRPGAMQIVTASGSDWAALSDGYADVGATHVTVLVSHCVLAGDIDAAVEAAEISQIEAGLNRLSGSDEDAAERAELEHRLEVAQLRREVAGR